MKQELRYINLAGNLMDFRVPRIMGILNITPDSFYKGSRFNTDADIISAAEKMVDEGADILDIGGYSSRPGAADTNADEESRRVLGAIKFVKKELPDTVISIDTFRAEIAREAVLGCGAQIINDISGGEADSRMFTVLKELNVPYVLMHMRGNPRTMQKNTIYDDVVADILRWFGERISRLHSEGVKDIIIDPGFGFSKTNEQNFEILSRLRDFSIADLPILAGVSRKSMVWKTLGINADEALNGTSALHMAALLNGADILRVHDVKEAVQVIRLFEKMQD